MSGPSASPLTSYSASFAASQSAMAQARSTAGQDPMKAAKEFESVFLNNFLASMFSGINTEAPFGGGQAEETWRDFLVKEYADQIVESGGIGITDAVYRELISLQEGAAQ